MKKVLSFVLAIALLCTLFVSAAFAAGTTIAVSEATAEHGDEVAVNVTIAGNPGFDTYLMSLDYDDTALELIGITAGALAAGGTFETNGNKATFMTTTLVENDGVLFTAKFKVLNGAVIGENAVAVVIDNLYNTVDLEEVSASEVPGSVTVEEPQCPHTTTKVVGAKEATCSEEGYTGDTVCSVCGEEIAKGSAIDKKAHTEKVVGAKEATCSEAGYTGDTVCSVCGEEIKKGSAIDKKEHNWNWVVDKKATATEAGSKHEECSVCGEKRNEGTVIPATGEELDDVPQTGDNTLAFFYVILFTLAFGSASLLVIKKRSMVK